MHKQQDTSGDDVILHQFDRALVWDGFKQLVPLSIFVIAFGAAFGLAAAQAGVDGNMAIAMSTLVFAGTLPLMPATC